jgi:hypothetical protein
MGSGAKASMRKGFLSHMRKCANISPSMRRPLVIYDFAPDPSEFPNFLVYEENFVFFFISVESSPQRIVTLQSIYSRKHFSLHDHS